MVRIFALVVAACLVSLSLAQSSLDASSRISCHGGLLQYVYNPLAVNQIDLMQYSGKLTKLIVPDCLSTLPNSTTSINITWQLPDAVGNLIISGRNTALSSVSVTADSVRYHGSYDSGFVIAASLGSDKVRNITYHVDHWRRGDSPDIDIYLDWPSRTVKCENTLTMCHVGFGFICLPDEWVCNGREECDSGIDESDCQGCCKQSQRVSFCRGVDSCVCTTASSFYDLTYINSCNGKTRTISMDYEPNSKGMAVVPQFPQVIPYNITYQWQPLQHDINLTLTFNQKDMSTFDLVQFFDGTETHSLNSMQVGRSRTMHLQQRYSPSLTILVTDSRSFFNYSYQLSHAPAVPSGAAPCDNNYSRSCIFKDLCYMPAQHCNDHMDCPNGRDEVGCTATKAQGNICDKNEISCPREASKIRCFTMQQRCDGNEQCTSRYDELNCDSTLCGPHNGTYLCPDGTCIFETWLCDKTKDCLDGADELNCDETSLKVVTASVIGSLVCAIMIVIAVGCSCKLHTHRLYESIHNRSRYESPMTMIQNELMRRAAPPPYAEAMQRSRPFDEVQSEYLAALEQHRNEESQRQEEDAAADEGRSIASVSGVIDGSDTSLVEVDGDNSVSYRRNPNKPPESTTGSNTGEPPLLPDLMDNSSVVLEPKSDDEQESDPDGVPQSTAEPPQSNNANISRRQTLRRSSVDSDVSLISRDSDDAPLLN